MSIRILIQRSPTASWNLLTQSLVATSELFKSTDWSIVEHSRTHSITRGEGSGEAGVGEGGADELESEVWEPLERAEWWLVDTSDGLSRSCRSAPLVRDS